MGEIVHHHWVPLFEPRGAILISGELGARVVSAGRRKKAWVFWSSLEIGCGCWITLVIG